MKLKIEKSAVIITPTIGKPQLNRCMRSVATQTYGNLKHLIVIDGGKYWQDAQKVMCIDTEKSNVVVTTSPENTGANGMYGHRIYAAFPHLVNEDYVFFLDEDNWLEPDHVSSLVDLIEKENLDFAHSLRSVYHCGELLAEDNCEAIGRWPVAWNSSQHLVDTSTYAFRREWLINVCQIWHWGWGGDRRFFMSVKDHAKYNTTGLHTMNYELPDMDKFYGGHVGIFKEYNEKMKQNYGGKYPWQI
jgi:glycosyltransferase involved in cell wall biosynthesis